MNRKPKFEIPHPGALLKEILDEMNVSHYRFAKVSGIDPSVLSGILSGRRRITVESAIRIGHALGCDPRSWINHQVSFDLDAAEKAKAAEFARIVPLVPAETAV